MLRGCARPWRALARDHGGAALVEFALVMTPLLTLILASLQLCIIFFAGEALQTVAMDSGRQLMTGAAQKSGVSQAQFKTAVCSAAPSFLNCNSIMVDVQSAGNYSSIVTTPPTINYDANGAVTNSWAYSPGGPGDVVIVRVMYDWPVVGGPLAVGLGNQPDGGHLMIGTTVFKNEPYQ
ncbi:MAG: TadE/TadG family type IV pilus assembly protein [Caulobacterales bacterium]